LIDESLGDGGAAPVVADVRREGPLRRLVGPYAAIGGNSLLGRFLAAEFVSSIGDWLYLVAMLVVIAETADPIVLGIVGGARILPYVVLSGVGGILADRYDRRRILIATDLLRGSVMLALAAAILASAPIGVIVGLVVLAACGSSLAGPALSAYLPTLTRDESELGPANAAWATLDNVAFIIGPAVAGVLTALGGAAGAMLLNAASFGVVAIVLASLPAKARSAAGAAAGQVVAADLAEAAGAGPDASAGRPMLGTREIGRRIAAPILVDVGVSLVGGALGLAMATSRALRTLANPLVQIFYPMPKSALIPLMLIWFGFGDLSKVVLIFLACLLPVIVSTYHGVKAVPPVILWSAQAMNTDPLTMKRRIMLPAALPSILTGVRLAMGFCFVLTISAEMIAAKLGIGKLIFFYGESGAYAYMFAGLLAVVVVAYALDRALIAFMHYVLRWHDSIMAGAS